MDNNNNNNNTTTTTTVNIEELKKLFDFPKYGSIVRFFRMIGEKPKDGDNYFFKRKHKAIFVIKTRNEG